VIAVAREFQFAIGTFSTRVVAQDDLVAGLDVLDIGADLFDYSSS
jgi:hypothetical protein